MSQYRALPLFPLPSHVLPGGRMALRIFEPRYLRMVKESYNGTNGFAICMLNEQGSVDANQHIWPIATRVQIVDFTPLEDGLLGLTVEGVERIEIGSIQTQWDGLRVADASALPNWPEQPVSAEHTQAKDCLKRVFDDYPELHSLYPQPHFDDASWVALRWLELVPLPGNEKQVLYRHADAGPTLTMLSSLLEKH
ncbi:LON peptidase substrate-binding domain-containing protein [Ferrimonas gelatinilytica]|uniref:LON peptidase substrate-binding domain-containing protein n=1 Tax=Ferrimonas gelatinilytica TaxID=1255257 RepID=A0ABP9S1R8_9GAMM